MKRLILVFLVFLYLLIGVLYYLLGVKPRRELRELNAQIRAEGRPVTIDDLPKVEVAEEDNAAPLFAEAHRLLEELEAEGKDLFEIARELGREEEVEVNRELFWRLMETSEAEKAMALIREGVERPGFGFAYDLSQGFKLRVPFVTEHLALNQFLKGYASDLLSRNQPDEALELAMLNYRFSEMLRREPLLIGQLVRTAGDALAMESMKQILAGYIPPKLKIEEIRSLIDASTYSPELRASLDVERVVGVVEGNLMDYGSFEGGDMLPLPDWLDFGPVNYALFLIAKPQDLLTFVEHMNFAYHASQDPYPDWHKPGGLLTLDEPSPWLIITSNMAFPESAMELGIKMEARRAVFLTGLDLLDHREAHGEFPESLELLGSSHSEDPFTTRPLRYERREGGFLLYSLGPDMDDDGGVEERPDKDDIAWWYPEPDELEQE